MIADRVLRFWRRCKGAWGRRELDEDLDEELAFHFAMKQGEGGSSEAAHRAMGNVVQAKESSREAWMFTRCESALKDVRYACGVLRKSPVFTTCAVLTLALGIGANAAIFSLIDALLLKTLPVAEPERVEQFSMNADATTTALSYPMFVDLQSRTRSYSGMFVWTGTQFSMGWGADARQVNGAVTSGAIYETRGIRPIAGRLIAPSDDVTGAPLVAVIGEEFWNREYHRDPGAIGRTILLERRPFTSIGVNPASFFGVHAGNNPSITIAQRRHSACAAHDFFLRSNFRDRG